MFYYLSILLDLIPVNTLVLLGWRLSNLILYAKVSIETFAYSNIEVLVINLIKEERAKLRYMNLSLLLYL